MKFKFLLQFSNGATTLGAEKKLTEIEYMLKKNKSKILKNALKKYSSNGEKDTYKLLCYLIGIIILSFSLALSLKNNDSTRTIFILIFSLALSPTLIILITILFGNIKYKNGIWDYLTGDEGSYSLSRLQAVLWALIIIALQIEIIFSLLLTNKFNLYEPTFSETSIWLLGLSLTSSIMVKGITLNKISTKPSLYKCKLTPKWRDILNGENGLDFSRTQMLLWTLIAIVVYISKCYYYTKYLSTVNSTSTTSAILNHMYEDYSSKPKIDDLKDAPFAPFLPWAFIVLMGLSQGAYVGKKLVPSFKLDDVKAYKQEDLQRSIQELHIKQNILNNIINATKANAMDENDKKNLSSLQAEIIATQQKIVEIKKDIQDIEDFKN